MTRLTDDTVGLTAKTTLDGTELLRVVNDPAGTPVARKAATNFLYGFFQRFAATFGQYFFNTADVTTNYERGFARWVSNVFEIGTEAGGTGTTRQFNIRVGSVTWQFQTSGGVFFPTTGITFGGNLGLGSSADMAVITNAAQSAGAGIELREMTAPSAPGSDRGRLYLEDNGSGKTRLMIRFATGAAQQVAIEP